MKKAYLAVMIIVVAGILGCTELKRINPTDPEASDYYVGMHYLGAIGDFSKLDAFNVMGDKIWCVDSVANRVYKYSISGDLDFSFTGVYLNSPTGICSDDTFIYVIDKDSIISNIKRFNPEYVSDTAQLRFPNYWPTEYIKCAASNTYLYAATATQVFRFDTAGNSIAAGTYAGFTAVSDIKYNASTDEVIVADSAADKLVVLSPSLTLIREINFTFDLIGFAIKDNFLYIPCAAGIQKFRYDNETFVTIFADYGEGAGKITAPGDCGVFGDYVLVGTGTTVKYFGP